MDPRNQENHLKKIDEKSLEKLQSRLIFIDPAYQYVFKKTEKIIAALYLITDLISDTEPAKWQLRKGALSLLSDMLTLRQKPFSQTGSFVPAVAGQIFEIISLIKILSVAGLVSGMNFSVIHKELVGLIGNIESINVESVSTGSILLSPDFFSVPQPTIPPPSHFSSGIFSNTNNAQSAGKGQYRTDIGQKDSAQSPLKKDNLKDTRRDKILSMLKTGKPLGIKDFSHEIKDCSEKTLQRELLAMVESSQIKKTGERRWSVYSL